MGFLNSISKKVMIGYIFIILVLVITAILLFQESSNINSQKQVFVEETLPTLKAVEEVSSGLNKIQIAAYELYGTTLTSDAFQGEMELQERVLAGNLDKLSRANLGNSRDLMQSKENLWQKFDNLRVIMSRDRVDWDGARDSLTEIQQVMQEMQTLVSGVNDAASRNAQASSDQITNEIANMRVLLVISVLLIFAITVASFLGSQQTIAKPIKDLSSELDRIAVEHDLSKDLNFHCNDEIGVAASSVNELIVGFREGNKNIQVSAATLVDSVSQLNHSAELSEAQVRTFTTHISELLHKINALETSIGESAQRSKSASDIALQGAEQVRDGAENVSRTSLSIEELAKDIERSAEMLLSLKNAGNQVSSVVKTIAEIAEQTNLLALNAAIEAARAGESGRGFAVVADEVRTLASRTHDSTHEINTILDSIVASISSTVTSMDSNKAKATESVELASTTVTSLGNIKDTVIKLSEENSELAVLGQSIRDNTSAMRGSVDLMQEASEQVTASSLETKTASGDLMDVSEGLSRIAGQFKV